MHPPLVVMFSWVSGQQGEGIIRELTLRTASQCVCRIENPRELRDKLLKLIRNLEGLLGKNQYIKMDCMPISYQQLANLITKGANEHACC